MSSIVISCAPQSANISHWHFVASVETEFDIQASTARLVCFCCTRARPEPDAHALLMMIGARLTFPGHTTQNKKQTTTADTKTQLNTRHMMHIDTLQPTLLACWPPQCKPNTRLVGTEQYDAAHCHRSETKKH